MISRPGISVIIPCRNMGKFLGQAIESVLAQTVPVLEIIVIDDKSTDETLAVLASYEGRVQIIHGHGRGSALARNMGILAARGDYIAFMDADDLWMPSKIERQIALLRDDQGFIFTDYYRSDDPLQPGEPVLSTYSAVAEGDVFSNLLRENFVSTTSVLVRKSVLASSGIFKSALIGGQDFDLWLRLAKHTKFGWVREPLVFMRKHAGNITGSIPYPYYHARVWGEILREHRENELQDLAYMKQRYGGSLYDAGRHAIRHMDPLMARRHFAKALSQRYRLGQVGFWYLITLLPSGLLNLLLRVKRAITERHAVRRSSNAVLDA